MPKQTDPKDWLKVDPTTIERLPPTTPLHPSVVAARLHVSESHLKTMRRHNEGPKYLKISDRKFAYRVKDVLDYELMILVGTVDQPVKQ